MPVATTAVLRWRRRTAAVVVAGVVLGLAGCAGGGARAEGPVELDPSPTPSVELTPVLSDTGYVVTGADGGPAYELRLRVYGEPAYDMATGELSLVVDDEDNGVQPTQISPADVGCGYQESRDLAVPVEFSFRNLGDADFTSQESFVAAVLDLTTGFDDPWYYYTSSFTYIDVASSVCDAVGVDSDGATVGSAAMTLSGEGYRPDGRGKTVYVLIFPDAKKLDPARLDEYLGSLAWEIDAIRPVTGSSYTFEFTSVEDSRVFGDACELMFAPLSLTSDNPHWSTLAEAGCDARTFH